MNKRLKQIFFLLQSKLSFQPSRSSNKRTELVFIYCQSHPIPKKTRLYKYTALPQYPHLLYLSSAPCLHHLLSTPPDVPVPITINKVFAQHKVLSGRTILSAHTHTHTHTHPRTHTHNPCMHAHTMHTHTHTHLHTHTQSLYACTHHTHTHVCARRRIHKHTHTHTRHSPHSTKSCLAGPFLVHTHARTHAHTHMHAHVRAHTHTHACMCASTSIHAHTHTHHTPHTHTHMGAHAHKCTIDKFNPHNRSLWQEKTAEGETW